MNEFLRKPRKLVLWAISLLTAAASGASLAESYHALWLWAAHHQVQGNWGIAWPLQIDTFIAIGEGALFVGLVDMWHHRKRVFPWAVALTGLAVSVAANVGHVETTDFWTRMTAAVPPVTAWASLVVGMGVLKRVVDLYSKQPGKPGTETGTDDGVPVAPEPRTRELESAPPKPDKAARRPIEEVLAEATDKFKEHVEAGTVPGIREIRDELGVGQKRAQQIQEHLDVQVKQQGHLAKLMSDIDKVRGTEPVEEPEESPGERTDVMHPVSPRSWQDLPLTPVKS